MLIEEDVLNLVTFSSMREEHIEQLLKKLKIGQHVVLLGVWEEVALGMGKKNTCSDALSVSCVAI